MIVAKQGGYAIFPILASIALLAAISMVIALSNRSASHGVYVNTCASEIIAQANLIRSKITKCAVEYPSGDNGTPDNKPYPAGSNVLVSDLICPGSGANLWTGVDGVFLPRQPRGFNAWRYTNNATGVRITLQSTNASAYNACMNRAISRFSSSEASLSVDTMTFFVKR